MKNILHKAPLIICFLVAAAFSIKTLREPDLWWQIRTGEWIIDNGQVPAVDVFSYTYEGSPWVNIKWGFEVLAAVVSRAAGPETVLLLQLLASMVLLVFIIKTARLITGTIDQTFAVLLPPALLLLLVGIAYRIIGRPELVSHLLTVVFLYVLHRYWFSKKIFLLIPLQIVWANCHEAFATGIILIFIFTISEWISYRVKSADKNTNPVMPVRLTITAVLSVACIIINPYGLRLLESPFNIFSQVFENKFTTELLGIDSALFWQKEAYIAMFMLMVILAGAFVGYDRKSKIPHYRQLINGNGLVALLLLTAFAYLASTAYRNIIFFDLVAFPYFVQALVKLARIVSANKLYQPVLSGVIVITSLAGIGLYMGIVTDSYYRYIKSNDHYGLQVLSVNNPTGAANYINAHQLSTKKAFTDYLTSSYLLWKEQPAFKTFIDLRDLDVFPSSFFEKFAEAVSVPGAFNRIDSQYRFDYAVVFRPQFATLHTQLFHDSAWSLRYIDAVAAVYEKSALKSNTTEFTAPVAIPASKMAGMISLIFNPFFKPFDYSSINHELEAGSFYLTIGEPGLAKQHALRALQQPGEHFRPLEMLGQIYYEQAVADTNAETRLMRNDSAMLCFNAAYKENSKYTPVLNDLGVIAYRKGNLKQALKYFEDAVDAEPENVNAHLFAAEVYKAMANKGGGASKKNIELAINHYLIAERLNPNNMTVKATLGFLYFNLKDCDKVQEYLEPVKDHPGLSAAEQANARRCLQNCGY